jgi:hypothetical protein
MRLTVPTKTFCCFLTCVRATYSRTKKSARWSLTKLVVKNIIDKFKKNKKDLLN